MMTVKQLVIIRVILAQLLATRPLVRMLGMLFHIRN